MKEFKLISVDNQILNVCLWDDLTKDPKAIVQLVHGSAEHMGRYDEFGKFLNKCGIIMVGDDHRGHGKTANDNNKPLGYFSWKNGWNKIVNDEKSINSFIEKKYPNLPIIMIGHSMGSFMVRDYAIKYSHTIDGMIISGTTEYDVLTLTGVKALAKFIRIFNGPRKPSRFIWKITYKPLNTKFQRKKSNGVEWLTRNKEVQQAFINDPLCGTVFSNSAFYDMFKGLSFIRKKRYVKLMRKNLPIMIAAGENDAVGRFGNGPTKVYNKLKGLNYSPMLKIYPKMRHEILFELENDQVQKDFLNFINTIVKTARR